jgi:trehalose/maltose hydrolase-like predicted phosphorylase
MSVVYGFGGMKVREGVLSFDPMLPLQWNGLSFTILYRERTLRVVIKRENVTLELLKGEGMDLYLYGVKKHLDTGGSLVTEPGN